LKRDPKSLLWDASKAADAIDDMTSGKTFAEFVGDIVLRSAVERQFEIIGEALTRLSQADTHIRRNSYPTSVVSSLFATF
jgi:uncharacterized protein with HEPN domain